MKILKVKTNLFKFKCLKLTVQTVAMIARKYKKNKKNNFNCLQFNVNTKVKYYI
jgi:hypothetical protein